MKTVGYILTSYPSYYASNTEGNVNPGTLSGEKERARFV